MESRGLWLRGAKEQEVAAETFTFVLDASGEVEVEEVDVDRG